MNVDVPLTLTLPTDRPVGLSGQLSIGPFFVSTYKRNWLTNYANFNAKKETRCWAGDAAAMVWAF
jgi:hypothetical protein